MIDLLCNHLEDCSTPQYFCFSIRCEVCGEYWYSSSIPFSKAVQETQHREKRNSMKPSINGKSNEHGQPPDRKPRSTSVNVPSVGGWFATPVSSSAMRSTCAGSVLHVCRSQGSRWRYEETVVVASPAVSAADGMQRSGFRWRFDTGGRGFRNI